MARSRLLGACNIRSARACAAPDERPAYTFCRWKARACTRFRSARCMPASSSRDIFASPPSGETVVRLEERLGYVHKGIESLMAGANIERAAKLAARTSGDSTVAYGIAFAHAVEAALGIEAPPRARYLRALMAELERLANHFGDIGAICNDASFAHHARPLRRASRTGVARGRQLFRPPADDGPGRSRRGCRRSACQLAEHL